MSAPEVKFSEFGGEDDPPYTQQQIDQICKRLDALKEPLYVRPPDTRLQYFKWIVLFTIAISAVMLAFSHRYSVVVGHTTIGSVQTVVVTKVDNFTGDAEACYLGDPLRAGEIPGEHHWLPVRE
jgi:hypothetical protein